MLPAGASEGHHKLALSLLAVQRDQVVDQRQDAFQKLPALRKTHHIIPHARLQAGVVLELLNIVRIGKTANVEYKIRVAGNSLLKAKGNAPEYDGIRLRLLGQDAHDALPKLGRFDRRRVDQIVRADADALHPFTFPGDRIFDGKVAVLHQRVPAAGEFVPLQQYLRVAVQEHDVIRVFSAAQLVHGLVEIPEGILAADVNHRRDLLLFLVVRHAVQVGKADKKFRWKIVDAVISHVLESIDGNRFAGSRQSRDDNKCHTASDPPLWGCSIFSEEQRKRRIAAFSGKR